jgi:flagellin-like hook-associated protein FlgL
MNIAGRITNHTADGTSEDKAGKLRKAQVLQLESELGTISEVKNYILTAEYALLQINAKINQIALKQVEARDPSNNSATIAKEIRILAGEIESILKNTNVDGVQLLASTDGKTPVSSPTFDIDGNAFVADFASSDYLNLDSLSTAIQQLITESDPAYEVTKANDLVTSTSAALIAADLKCEKADALVVTTGVALTAANLSCEKADNLVVSTGAALIAANLKCEKADALVVSTRAALIAANLACEKADALVVSTFAALKEAEQAASLFTD